MLFRPLAESIDRLTAAILQTGTRIMSALDNLTAAVSQNTSVEASAVTLIQGLASEIKNAAQANDTAAVQSLADQITASSTALAQAVTANTPAQGATTAAGAAPASTPAPAASQQPTT